MDKRYIEKESLIAWLTNMEDAISEAEDNKEINQTIAKVYKYIIKVIDDDKRFPVANVEEKIQAKWIIRLNYCECDNCGTRFRYNKADISTYLSFYNFDHCPKCGAAMINSYYFKEGMVK